MIASQPTRLDARLWKSVRADYDQPRTHRLAPDPAQQAAYRRLAVAILGLDVATLANELRPARRADRAVRRAA